MDTDVRFPLMGLLVNETVVTVKTLLESDSWDAAMEKVIANNLMDKTRSLSAKRYFREIQLRLENAYDWELQKLASSISIFNKTLICYLICMRTYNLAAEFFEEVLLEKYKEGDIFLEDYEVRVFIRNKTGVYPRLAEVSDTTESRMRTYLVKIFREVGIITGMRKKRINPVILPDDFEALYKSNEHNKDLRFFIS